MSNATDTEKTQRQLVWRYRLVLLLFMFALVVSGVTAFPLLWELRILDQMVGAPTDSLGAWISYVREGLEESYRAYPFIAYGTDWLAFSHLAIAVFFIGPLLRPLEYQWTLISGMIACAGVLLLAFICGPLRGIPFYWQLVDCSFGVFGILPLLYCYFASRKLKRIERDGA
jgi:hypothetical protein